MGGDLLALLALPALAAAIFVGIHTWLGLQVLRRNVVFADLALAQLAALGGTIAVALGHAPNGPGGFAYALVATLFGAVLLTASRRLSLQVSQEAIIGVLYVVATALTVLVVDRSPQGAEHVKRMLVGSILTVGPADVLKLLLLYGAIGGLHALCRRPLLAAARETASGSSALWDFVFYASFGVVVTSSVAHAGVLLVFSFLIIPAVIGTLFTGRIGAALAVGWSAGIVASAAGFAASVLWDLPTGAALVAAFGGVLALALPLRFLAIEKRAQAGPVLGRLGRAALGLTGLAVLVQGAWLLAAPAADQPLLAVFESVTGLGPERYLTRPELAAFREAREFEERHRRVVDELGAQERAARWQANGFSEEDVRRVASVQQTFNEMGRGERFVQEHLRGIARARERWWVGLPALVVGALGSALLVRRRRKRGAATPGGP